MKKIILVIFSLFLISCGSEVKLLDYHETDINIIKGIKYGTTVTVPIIENKFPDEELLLRVVNDIRKNNRSYDNYFIGFKTNGIEPMTYFAIYDQEENIVKFCEYLEVDEIYLKFLIEENSNYKPKKYSEDDIK